MNLRSNIFDNLSSINRGRSDVLSTLIYLRNSITLSKIGRGRSDASSTLSLPTLLDSELTNKLKIEADVSPARWEALVKKKKKKLLQLGFGQVADK